MKNYREKEEIYKFLLAAFIALGIPLYRMLLISSSESLYEEQIIPKYEVPSESLSEQQIKPKYEVPSESLYEEQIKVPSNAVASDKVTVLVAGRNGVGKSTLIDGLVNRTTKELTENSHFTSRSLNINGVQFTIFLLRSIREEDETLEKLKEKIEEVDLIMYAIKMDDTRIRPTDTRFIRTLSQYFGPHFWAKAMFVLTFANRVFVLDENYILKQSKDNFDWKYSQWRNFVQKTLSEEGLTDVEVNNIPIVAVGHVSETLLFEIDWTQEFVSGIYKRLKEDVKGALLKVCAYC